MTSQTLHAYWTTRDPYLPYVELKHVEGESLPDRAHIQLGYGQGGLYLEREKIKAFCREYLEMERQIEIDARKREQAAAIVERHHAERQQHFAETSQAVLEAQVIPKRRRSFFGMWRR